MLARAYSVKALFSVSGLKEVKLIKKQIYKKTETCKLYSRDFWIFLPDIIEIDHYDSELHCFEVGAFFETQCRYWHYTVSQKMHQHLNGVAQNYRDRFWWYLAEIFKRFSNVSVFM